MAFPMVILCPSPPGSDEDSNLDPSPLPDLDSESCFPTREDEEEEEERWLDALEKGELDDNGELKKEVDESLLTARQVRGGMGLRGGRQLRAGCRVPLPYVAVPRREPSCTSSRASRCWSCPWATRPRS